MTEGLDDHNQPHNTAYNWNRIKDSRMDELIGICRGILADGIVVAEEAIFLRDWLHRNKQVRHTLPGKMLVKLLDQVLADGKLTEDEEVLVVDMLAKVIGGTPEEKYEASYSTTLPINDPEPEICFRGGFNSEAQRRASR